MPSALLSCLLLPLRGQETRQKQVGIGHRGRLKMKRRTYILSMMLVAAVMLGLLWWAASFHNVRGYSPVIIDRVIAVTIFWSTLFMPIAVSLILSLKVVSRDIHSQWPIFELAIIGLLLLAHFGPHVFGRIYGKILPKESVAIPVTYALVVVSVGLSVLNTRLGIQDRKWGRTGLSVLIALGGTAVLLIGNAWAIYLE